MTIRPPRIARAIVGLAAEPDDRPWLLADLDEEFAGMVAASPGAARRWYWRQAVTSLLPLVRRRARRRRPTPVSSRPTMWNGFRTEIRHALRFAARTPAPTSAILLTMALGIGATAAISTVVWKVLLQPLPLREPERVLAVYRVVADAGTVIPSVAYPDLEDWRRRTKSFAGIAPYTSGEATLIKDNGPAAVNAVQVGADFFAVLGSRFALGRAFDRSEFAAGAAPVVILSPAMWQREFAGDPHIVGRSIELASGRATVVGVVAPGEFTLPVGEADLWEPLHVPTSGPNAWMSNRATQWLQAVARVRSDVALGTAVAELRTVDEAVQREFPRPANALTVIGVTPLHEFIVGPVRTTLLFLAGAVIIVLLVAGTNIATLRLAQAQSRSRELAMRLVLGAGFGRLLRQLLTESTMLAIGGAAGGVVLAYPVLQGLLALYPGTLPRADEVRLDPVLVAWSLAVAIAAGVLFAVPQIVQVGRLNRGSLARDGDRGTATQRHRTAWRAMVVLQLALSVGMLVVSGLLMRTFVRITRVSPGFEAGGVLTFALSAPSARYQSFAATEQLFQELTDRIRALPGVRLVGATNALPLTFNPMRGGIPRPNAAPSDPMVPVNTRLVTPGYLELLRVPLRRGRALASTDDATAPSVAVINEALAAALYPGEDPIGKVLPIGGPSGRTVVGVVGNLHHSSLTTPADPEVYLPFRQMGARRTRVLAMRVDGDPLRLAEAVTREVHAVDPRLPIRSMRSLDEILSAAVAPQRFRAAFIGSLAALALVLATIGVYGVMSWAVSERRRELGIRVALGELPSRIRRRVIGEGLQLAALGTALGAGAAWLAARALRSFMFGVDAVDPWTFGAVAVLLAVVTVVAADGPARRAGRVDPVAAIRGE